MPKTATVERRHHRSANSGVLPAMLTVHEVAALLNCSPRTIYRLTDTARIPRPIKLGALVRWPRDVIEQWITAGCPKPGSDMR